MDLVRYALEKMYIGTCDVIEHQKVQDPVTRKTGFADTTVILSQPCRLSFSSSPITGDGVVAGDTQNIKLFIAPEIEIKSGSKIEVTQNGVKKAYMNSGEPAIYETHQEISLKLFERWS